MYTANKLQVSCQGEIKQIITGIKSGTCCLKKICVDMIDFKVKVECKVFNLKLVDNKLQTEITGCCVDWPVKARFYYQMIMSRCRK